MADGDSVRSGSRIEAERVHPDPIAAAARQLDVVDTDFHFLPDFERLRPYLAEPFRSKLLRLPLIGSDYNASYAISLDDNGQTVHGRARTAADVLRVLDEIGVGTVILSPGYPSPTGMFNPTMASAVAAAYNDYVASEVLPASPRIRAYLAINQREPLEAAREIRRMGAHTGFVAVYGEFGPTEPIGSSRHDPLFDALQEFDLPLTLHGGRFWPQGTTFAGGLRTWTELLGISWPAIAMTYLGSMVMQGLFDKYPRQRVVLQEGGLWWLIEFVLRADEFYLNHPGDIQLVERKLEAGETHLRRHPSEYVFENVRFSTQPMCRPVSNRHFAWLLEIARAEEMLLYSSDWPHTTFDPINWMFQGAVLSPAARARIAGGNARAWFSRL